MNYSFRGIAGLSSGRVNFVEGFRNSLKGLIARPRMRAFFVFMATENLYLIELHNNEERFYKIGTTVHRYCRFYQIMKFGYSAKITYMLMGVEFYKALEYEKLLQSKFKPYQPKTWFGGHRECFSNVDINLYKKIVSDLQAEEIVENLEISWR